MSISLTLQFVLGPFDFDKMGVDLLLQLFYLSCQPANLTFLWTQVQKEAKSTLNDSYNYNSVKRSINTNFTWFV